MVFKMVLSMPLIPSVRQISIPESIRMSMLSMPSNVNARVDSNNTVVAVGPSNVNARVDSMLSMPSILSKWYCQWCRRSVKYRFQSRFECQCRQCRRMQMPESIRIILSMPSVRQNGTVDGTVNARVDSNNTVDARVGPLNVNARAYSMPLMLSKRQSRFE